LYGFTPRCNSLALLLKPPPSLPGPPLFALPLLLLLPPRHPRVTLAGLTITFLSPRLDFEFCFHPRFRVPSSVFSSFLSPICLPMTHPPLDSPFPGYKHHAQFSCGSFPVCSPQTLFVVPCQSLSTLVLFSLIP